MRRRNLDKGLKLIGDAAAEDSGAKYSLHLFIQGLFLNLKIPFMQGLFVFLHWKILNRRFGICASNKFLSHSSPEINDGRDFISFPWPLSQVKMGLGQMDGGSTS
jgi:hypothetical protein